MVFDKAAKECGLDLAEERGKILEILDERSSLWESLDALFPGSRAQVAARKIRVVIDRFADFSGGNPAFASYFIRLDQRTIGLDCTLASRAYWLPSLAHEMTHALVDNQMLQSGWEEGLAQFMEHNAGGDVPDLSLATLRLASVLPTVLETRRPLPSHESYGITYAFVSYVYQQFGGWPVLQAMTSANTAGCEAEDFLSRIACRGRRFLQQGQGVSTRMIRPPLGADKMTRAGLLRYFYVALALNDPVVPSYSISGWNGFATIPAIPSVSSLEPGQAVIFTQLSSLGSLSSELEGYQVLLNAAGAFRIFPFGTSSTRADFQPNQNFSIVLNLGTQTEQISQ
jgi:hypothetical protein